MRKRRIFVNDRGNHRIQYSTKTANISTDGTWATNRPTYT
jgi:hypothetical protein